MSEATETELERCPEHGHVIARWYGDNWYFMRCPDCPRGEPPLDVSGWPEIGFIDGTGV